MIILSPLTMTVAALTYSNIKEAKLEKSTLEERIEHLEHRLKDSKSHMRQKVFIFVSTVCCFKIDKTWSIGGTLAVNIKVPCLMAANKEFELQIL